MNKITYLIAICFLVIASFVHVHAQSWKIADGYSVKFDAGDPSGEFTELKGSIVFDEKNLAASKFDVTIDAASINTGNGMKNTHAKSENWFDVAKYPNISFTSSAITKTSAGYEAKGTLDMHGVKKEIAIPFTFVNNTFASTFEVNRIDFGIDDGKHDKMPANLKISLNVPVTQ
jgi:polyisoprenoid-binding protein YceI